MDSENSIIFFLVLFVFIIGMVLGVLIIYEDIKSDVNMLGKFYIHNNVYTCTVEKKSD